MHFKKTVKKLPDPMMLGQEHHPELPSPLVQLLPNAFPPNPLVEASLRARAGNGGRGQVSF